jgi:branched-chain amino acid aminotransferase
MSLGNQRVAYFNGKIVPDDQVVVPFRDRGFKYGDAVFDSSRTFGGEIFKLEAHIDRLYRSLRYLRIDPGLSRDGMTDITRDVLERNRHLLGPGEDYWVSQRISRGTDPIADEAPASGPTVIVECTPLPFRARAPLYRDGIKLITPSVRRTSPESLSPNAKTHNYLNMVVGDLEARALDSDAWALLLDSRGFLAEGLGSNIFLVRDGGLLTPKRQQVLEGVSRATVIELASKLGIAVVEDDLTPYDAYIADEAFISSTSLCICPARSLNGARFADPAIPGPVTARLIDEFCELVRFDYVTQYLAHLS